MGTGPDWTLLISTMVHLSLPMWLLIESSLPFKSVNAKALPPAMSKPTIKPCSSVLNFLFANESRITDNFLFFLIKLMMIRELDG